MHKVSVESMQQLKNSPFAQTSRRPLAEALKSRLEQEQDHPKDRTPTKRGKLAPVAAQKVSKSDEDVAKIQELISTEPLNTEAIIDVLCSRSSAQRQMMAKKYQDRTNRVRVIVDSHILFLFLLRRN